MGFLGFFFLRMRWENQGLEAARKKKLGKIYLKKCSDKYPLRAQFKRINCTDLRVRKNANQRDPEGQILILEVTREFFLSRRFAALVLLAHAKKNQEKTQEIRVGITLDQFAK